MSGELQPAWHIWAWPVRQEAASETRALVLEHGSGARQDCEQPAGNKAAGSKAYLIEMGYGGEEVNKLSA